MFYLFVILMSALNLFFDWVRYKRTGQFTLWDWLWCVCPQAWLVFATILHILGY